MEYIKITKDDFSSLNPTCDVCDETTKSISNTYTYEISDTIRYCTNFECKFGHKFSVYRDDLGTLLKVDLLID
jgi:hypothetical protein